MTKRQALLAAIAGTIGIMSERAKSENMPGTVTTTDISVFKQQPQSVTFNLDTFAKFTFNLGDESVTVTGKEIFDAIKGP